MVKINRKQTYKMFKEITELPGISGYEGEVADFVSRELKGYITKSFRDGLGSIINVKKGASDSPKIMIAGHMDEVGFMVRGITKEGFIKFETIGGWWGHVVLGQRVNIYTNKGIVLGIIGAKSPHICTPEERKKVMQCEDMFIDIGVSTKDAKKTAEKLGIRVGDPIVPISTFEVMNGTDFLLAKAWDNRIGVAVMMEVLKQFKQEKHPNTIYGVGTVQEEVGLRGATTSAFAVEPDIAFAVDTTIGGDTPGIKDGDIMEKLGEGPSISVMDASIITNPRLKEFMIAVAEEEKIPYQTGALAKGGTDSGRIQMAKSGVPTMTLSIASRYIHSHNSIIHYQDYVNLVKLLVSAIKRLDSKKVAEIKY